ncbi:MAG: hypothetical protein CHACPFDD_03023 [Phycisphaerae bacterium]|nr:hypothetical protein [Phycisphaerae bacterium]
MQGDELRVAERRADAFPALVEVTPRGLYCAAGDFYVDPWRKVERAVVTHAHSDHARPGSARYLCAAPGVGVLRERLGARAAIEPLEYGAVLTLGDVRVSLHPAGHVLGSAQVLIESGGFRCVISGDYKRDADPTCAAFEPVRCETFITESTFGLPIYRWRPAAEIFDAINAWWRRNQRERTTSVVLAYAIGKAQRILAGVDASIGPIVVHREIGRFVRAYREAGVALPRVRFAEDLAVAAARGRGLVIAPPQARGTRWLRKFRPCVLATASGWASTRNGRPRLEQAGFALSDHADWDGLLRTIRETGAANVGVTHGYAATLARYLGENGWNSRVIATRYGDEEAEAGPAEGLLPGIV